MLAGACAAAGAAPAGPWRSVRGAELDGLLVNQELTDDAHYAYRFRADGSFDGEEMGKTVRGSWRATSGQMCWAWRQPKGSEECYDVQRQDKELRFLRHGREAHSGRIVAIPPVHH